MPSSFTYKAAGYMSLLVLTSNLVWSIVSSISRMSNFCLYLGPSFTFLFLKDSSLGYGSNEHAFNNCTSFLSTRLSVDSFISSSTFTPALISYNFLYSLFSSSLPLSLLSSEPDSSISDELWPSLEDESSFFCFLGFD